MSRALKSGLLRNIELHILGFLAEPCGILSVSLCSNVLLRETLLAGDPRAGLLLGDLLTLLDLHSQASN